MKRVALTAGALAALCATAACRPKAYDEGLGRGRRGEQAVPDLYLPETVYDAGRVRAGDVVRHVFVVKNRGLGELNIEKVQGT